MHAVQKFLHDALELIGKLNYSFIERSAKSKADHFTQITCIRIIRAFQ